MQQLFKTNIAMMDLGYIQRDLDLLRHHFNMLFSNENIIFKGKTIIAFRIKLKNERLIVSLFQSGAFKFYLYY